MHIVVKGSVRRGCRRAAAALAVACCSVAASAAAASAQSLEEALAAAYSTNPQLLSERARLRATDEQVAQALSGWRPTVEVQSSAGLSRFSSSGGGSSGRITIPGTTTTVQTGGVSSSGTQTLRSHSYGLSVTQPLYRGGRTVAQTAQAESIVRAERATLVATEQTVLLNAATAYMDVLRDEALLRLQIDNEQILRQQLQAVEAQFRFGTAIETDVQLARSRLATAVSGRQTAEGNLATSRESYEQFVGEPPQRLSAPRRRPPVPATLDLTKRLAATSNPTVIAADFTRQAAIDSVRVVRGQLLPQISLNGQADRSVSAQSVDRTTDDLSVTAQVTVPLYEGGQVYSQVREAQQTVAQRTHDLDAARRQAVQTAGAAWDAWQSARATILSNEEAVRAEEAALRGIQAQYRAGTRSIIDVLNEQQVLLNNRINLVAAQRNEAVAAFQIAVAVGRFTAIDLALPVMPYDPNRNYNTVREKWIGYDLPDSRE
jgi:TolC family type I secretion outer membrane protein